MTQLDLSAIVIMPLTYRPIRKTLAALQAQTIKDRLEVVLIVPSESLVDRSDKLLQGFGGLQVVGIGPITAASEARAVGVRQATAPIVVFTEDHCFPDENWAEALTAAHREPWAAVGPVIGNANPGTRLSWAMLYTNYGRWVEPSQAGEREFLAGHNTSYKRALLLEYGDRLPSFLINETMLHWDLRARGHHFYLSSARVFHVNISKPSSVIRNKFLSGRTFAGARAHAQHWTWPKRWLYGACTPYLSAKRLFEIIGFINQTGRGAMLVRLLPSLLLALGADGLGETVGYWFGIGNAEYLSERHEFDRGTHLIATDQHWLENDMENLIAAT